MALQAISKAEAVERKSAMATAPVKSQPLHNFSLPFLKWGKNQMNNHRCRKLVDTSRESPPRDHRSSASETESEGGSPTEPESKSAKNPVGSRSAKNRFSFANCSSSTTSIVGKPEKNPTVSESSAAGEETRSNLIARLQKEIKVESESKKKLNGVTDEGEGGEIDVSVQKPWNLRPRRGVLKAPNEIGGACKNGELQEKPENLPKSCRLRSFAEAQNVEKKEKRRLSIALSREEIDEDFFVITGSKASRRPKKRAKNIQKLVDNVFPGLWLVGLTADSYSIPDVPAKK